VLEQTFAISCVKIQALIYLFVKVHTYLDQKTAKELFGLRVKLPLVITILTTKANGNPATYLQLKKTTSELVCFFLHYSFNV